ncbi:hypothetical protein [Desulfosporosinus orientis]|nr:hypothetical protein [Desulfosporosinus orientis]
MVKKTRVYCGVILVILAVIGFSGFVGFPASGGNDFPVQAAADLDGDGITEEYSLVDHCLTVREGDEELWRSPRDWRVDTLALGDADNDGTLNMVITLWKKGSFGALKPFWLTGEDTGYKNHLFVYGLKDKTMKQAWCSSDLDQPIISLTIRDWDGDGLNELVVEEGQYRRIDGEEYTLNTHSQVRTTVWRWDEWGFGLISPL